MDAVKYFKERQRMCKAFNHFCYYCPFTKDSGEPCGSLQKKNPEEAVEIVEKWSAEHPQKTMMSDFFEKHPNAKSWEDGTPNACPYKLGYEEEAYCKNHTHDCKYCWNRPLEG